MMSSSFLLLVAAAGLYIAAGQESSLHLADTRPESLQHRPESETDAGRFRALFYFCKPGYIWNGYGCFPCPNGYHSPGGTEVCIQCPKGTKGPDNDPAAPCTKCAPGTYNNKIGSETCSKCPAGTSSGTGASKCTDCPRGKTSKAGQLCTDCPEGTYAKVAGSSKCLTCNAPAGSQKGAYRCNKCAAGSSATGDNAICKPCPANFYSAARFAEDCTRCPPLYTSGPGSSGCTAYL